LSRKFHGMVLEVNKCRIFYETSHTGESAKCKVQSVKNCTLQMFLSV
jgi:hypothetical protein